MKFTAAQVLGTPITLLPATANLAKVLESAGTDLHWGAERMVITVIAPVGCPGAIFVKCLTAPTQLLSKRNEARNRTTDLHVAAPTPPL
ncbi:MAG: hypothetical protein H0X34_05795 [Chthoniobacterales bacterium]|jgi:hypothetical protein|nr:hypothetical protein [Chthoniobacterales bacterium]